MQDIRLVALDLDGTVFNDKKEITPRTLAAIRNAVARGVAVLPATGRTASGIPAAFTSIPGVRYALTSNGASVVDLQTGQQLVKQPFAAACWRWRRIWVCAGSRRWPWVTPATTAP